MSLIFHLCDVGIEVMTACREVTKPHLPIWACSCARKLILHVHGCLGHWVQKCYWFLICVMYWRHDVVCSGSVVVIAYDSESGRPGSNPEWGTIYYEASITAQGLPEPSSLRGSTLGTRAAVTGACKLIDGCSLVLCSATGSVVSSGICHRNKVNSTAWLSWWAIP